jgi:hypothetical protein
MPVPEKQKSLADRESARLWQTDWACTTCGVPILIAGHAMPTEDD